MKVTVEGRKELARKLIRAARDVDDELATRRRECAEDLNALSVPVTPLSVKRYPSDPVPGELKLGAFVDHVSRPNTSIVGNSDPKAPFVHELGIEVHKGVDIDWSTPGTGAKFLSNPFKANEARYAAYMKAAGKAIHR